MATMRYSTSPDEPDSPTKECTGWLWKEGRLCHNQVKRYLKLDGTTLSNHRKENSKATWKVDILGAEILSGEFDDNRIIVKNSKRMYQFRTESPEDFRRWIMALTKATKTTLQIREVHSFYDFSKMVGKGSNGEVFEAHDKMTSERFAIKVMEIEDNERDENFAKRECDIVRRLDHDNIVRVFDVFRSSDKLYFVLEFIEGGELFDIVSEEKNFTEKQASQVMKGILNGVLYLHNNKIAHRDLKLESELADTTSAIILVASRDWPLQIKIADFGLSGLTDGKQVLTSFVGTPFYLAPEIILQQDYGSAVDMWSVGVILYVVIAGKFPFGGASDLEYLKQVVRKDIRFPEKEWRDISDECKHFILGLLERDPKHRLTAHDALEHPWISNIGDSVNIKNIQNDRAAMHSSRRLPRIDQTHPRASIKLSQHF